MSVRTTSGFWDSTASRRPGRSATVATTSTSGAVESRAAVPSRTRKLSSANTTRRATSGWYMRERGRDGATVADPPAIRVVLGDDNVLVREGVRALLSATEGIEVVGVAEEAT